MVAVEMTASFPVLHTMKSMPAAVIAAASS
jgi:hypothetical protein